MKRKRRRRCKEIRREEVIRGRGEEGTYCTIVAWEKRNVSLSRKEGGKEGRRGSWRSRWKEVM